LAVTVNDNPNSDIYIKELPRGTLSRLTDHPAWDVRPRWTLDGQAITFLSDRGASYRNANVFFIRASGAGDAVLLWDLPLAIWEAVYSKEMDWLLARTGGSMTDPGGRDVWAMRVEPDSVSPVLETADFDEKAISLSDDGRFLLYESNETEQNEVYVRTFPNVDGDKVTVSAGGGVMPVWSRATDEIFYVNAEGWMMAARVETDPRFRVVDRTELFQLPENILFRQNEQYPLYDVSPDGQRFIMFRIHPMEAPEPKLAVVWNWPAELER
jgi:Tol biopolymer transport system component